MLTTPTDPAICAIAVMAKAPRPGKVKTRLVPPLSFEAATQMSAAFLRDITENLSMAGRSASIAGYVAYAPAGLEHLFDGMLADGTRLILADGEGEMPEAVQGFGRCLLHATRELFARGHAAACLLNSDSPTLPTSILVRLAEELARPGDRVVLGPADDGGYYTIGLKAPHARVFEDIAWSTDRVADQTRARAASIGLDLVELPTWFDVDDRAALTRLLDDFAAPPAHDGLIPFAATATTSAVARLGIADVLRQTQPE